LLPSDEAKQLERQIAEVTGPTLSPASRRDSWQHQLRSWNVRLSPRGAAAIGSGHGCFVSVRAAGREDFFPRISAAGVEKIATARGRRRVYMDGEQRSWSADNCGQYGSLGKVLRLFAAKIWFK